MTDFKDSSTQEALSPAHQGWWGVAVFLLISGVLAVLAGPVVVVISMVGAFQKLAGPGIADPQGLSEQIGGALMGSATALVLIPVGLLLIILGIVYRRKPARPPSLPRKHQDG